MLGIKHSHAFCFPKNQLKKEILNYHTELWCELILQEFLQFDKYNCINILHISRKRRNIYKQKKTSDENDIHLMISGTVGTKYAFTTALAWTIIERDRLKWNELKICVLFLTLLIFSMCSALFFLFWRVFRYRIKHMKLDTSVWFVICNLSS